MDNRLKTVIQWSIFILVLLGLLLIISSIIIVMLQPTLFPSVNIDGFKNCISVSSILVSFLSAGLGFFSVWQSSRSGKQSIQILDELTVIKEKQTTINANILDIKKVNISQSSTSKIDNWTTDGSNE